MEFTEGTAKENGFLNPAVFSKEQTATEPARATGLSGH